MITSTPNTHACIPSISLILYPKVGHMPSMEIPEILAEDIKNFIVN